jgi:opacity protein-like surface antigen
MNRNVENSLKGVSTMKVGLEFKPDPAVAVRFGYNYVSPMYSSNGMRDSRIESIGVTYASTADYTNWKDTHRITCGLGYKFGHVNVDLAYQYSMTKGDFYPMQDEVYYLDTNNNLALDPYFVTPTKVDFKRHQVLLTLGYTF